MPNSFREPLAKVDEHRLLRRKLAFVVAVPTALAACAVNIVAQPPPGAAVAPQGTYYRCAAGQKDCQTNPEVSEDLFNPPDATRFSLPSPLCPNGLGRFVVQNAGGSNAVLIAQCAAPSPNRVGGDGGI